MIDPIARTTVILGVTWLICRLSPRATAATRHLLWHLAVIAVLVAPLAMPLMPTYEVPSVPAVPRVPDVLAVPGMHTVVESRTVLIAPTWPMAVNLIWSIGSALVFLWYATGYVASVRRIQCALCAPGAVQHVADTLVRRSTRVLIAPDDTGPFVAGILRASIVLPVTAQTWDANRLRTVLLHEMAHVRRGDCRVQLLAQAACAIYWFNPLIWIAARALRIERERACDDEVIARGATPSVYAADLLELARARQMQWASPAVLAMARPSELEGRLRAILSVHRVRVPARATRFKVAIAVAVLAIATFGARSTAYSPQVSVDQEKDRERATLELALDSRPDVVPALIAALRDPDSQVREKAALGLGWRSDDRVIAPLIAALDDDDSQVREKAALALGSSGSPLALSPLEQALRDDPNGQVREKAAAGLTLLRAGGDQAANGKQVREALNQIVGGLLQLTQQ